MYGDLFFLLLLLLLLTYCYFLFWLFAVTWDGVWMQVMHWALHYKRRGLCVFFFCFNVIVGCLLSLLWCFCVYWYRKWMFLFRGSIMMRFTGTWVSMTITLSRLRLEHWRLLRYSSSASSPSSCYLCVSAFSYLYVFLIFTLLIWLFIAIISGYCDEQLL